MRIDFHDFGHDFGNWLYDRNPILKDSPLETLHPIVLSYMGRGQNLPYHILWDADITLWLCQNSYWKLPFIVDFPSKNGDFP